MTLLRLEDLSGHEVTRTFRYPAWPWLLLLAFWAPSLPAGGLLAWNAASRGALFWTLAAVLGVPAVLLYWLILDLGIKAASACFRPTNWIMKVTPAGVFVKFRSYLNYHFSEDGPTVVFLPFREIAGARRYDWRSPVDAGEDRPELRHKYLELQLADRDTEPLRAAIAAEASRKIRPGRSGWRANHVPVLAPSPGVVQLDWRGRKMLRALEGKVALRPEGSSPATEPISMDVAGLAQRGDKMEAIREARLRYGLSLAGARRHVEELMAGDASGRERSGTMRQG